MNTTGDSNDTGVPCSHVECQKNTSGAVSGGPQCVCGNVMTTNINQECRVSFAAGFVCLIESGCGLRGHRW